MEPKQGYKVIPNQYNLQDLESNLREFFQPVVPSTIFVAGLKKSLLRYPRWKIALPGVLKSIMLVSAGLVSGVLILVTGIRAIVTILGTFKILRQIKTQVNNKQVSATQTGVLSLR
jgi:ribose/xylose/arabinose/galactoside ABC-type transport system permease subunit